MTDTPADLIHSLDVTVAHQARVYDYWLGGKDNFEADRAAAEQAIRDYPAIVTGVKAQRALLASRPEGITDYLDADLRDTGAILTQAAGTLDLSQPVAILLIGILQLIGDSDEPHAIVRRLLDAVPSGSWLALVHPADDVVPEVVTMAQNLSRRSVTPTTLRNHAEVSRFFDGLELLPPGVVELDRWEPGVLAPGSAERIPAYGGVARKA